MSVQVDLVEESSIIPDASQNCEVPSWTIPFTPEPERTFGLRHILGTIESYKDRVSCTLLR